MTAEYTPTTEEMREYVEMGGQPTPWLPPTPEADAARAAAFDRWLAAHDASLEAVARKLDELRALTDLHEQGATRWADPLPIPTWVPLVREILEATCPFTVTTLSPTGTRRIHTKRCCNGCARVLGDVTDTEMAAAIEGLPLPDVRDECGCLAKAVQS